MKNVRTTKKRKVKQKAILHFSRTSYILIGLSLALFLGITGYFIWLSNNIIEKDGQTKEIISAARIQSRKLTERQTEWTGLDALEYNTVAPEISGVSTWINTSKPILLKSLQGKYVAVIFWRYACSYCLEALGGLEGIEEKYKDDLTIIGIHMARYPEETGEVVKNYIQSTSIDYPIGITESRDLSKIYNLNYVPAVYIIDRAGRIKYSQTGYGGDFKRLKHALNELLRDEKNHRSL